MTINFINNNGDATITLSGRLDTSASSETKAEIDKYLTAAGNIISLTMDAEGLEYISSSGLRILLALAKSYKNFKLVGVNTDVYDVLSMTGFTKIINVERGLRKLSIDGCEQIGVGGVGTVYRLDGDTIIKVFREGTTMDEVRKEITMSKEAFVMGTPTAISFDIVKVGTQYGLVYELLNAETLSSCIMRSPERINEYARQYANLFHQLHSIEVPADSNVPNAIEHERQQILHVRRYFPQESIDLLLEILDAIPTSNRLLHLDLQVKNTMMQDNELMLIDMGEMGYGHPVLDLAHAYSSMVLFVGDYDATIGIPRELGNKIWDIAINYYFEGQPAEVVELRKKQIDVVARIRNFSWLALSDSFPESVINQCKELFDQRVTARRDYILDVCKTLKDWTL
jgi:uncharacterized protein (TIGR02172 family)